ncbi:MAG: hypothetical protein M3R38_14885 [Actinomycetota bacterium]|nr:hypothetical protein [Actinomycetota bacterium]
MASTIRHASIAEKEAHEKALAGVWGPILRLKDKEFFESMQLIETFGGVLEAASRDGAVGKPNPCFTRPYFGHSGTYLDVYAVKHIERKGFPKERFLELRAQRRY